MPCLLSVDNGHGPWAMYRLPMAIPTGVWSSGSVGAFPERGRPVRSCLGLLLGALLQESLYPEADAERTQEIMREDLV